MCKDTTLKFNVESRLNNLIAIEKEIAMRNLPTSLNTTRQTLHKIRTCKADDTYNPDLEVMVGLASFFKCDVRELYNNPPDEITIESVQLVDQNNTAKELHLTA